jgi:hypothetical protein
MAKKKKVISTATNKQIEPTTSKYKKGVATKNTVATQVATSDMLFKKQNYLWMFGGIGLIALGLILMSGGSMPNADTWDANLIYSFRRITLAPIVILTGLAFQIVAIFKK